MKAALDRIDGKVSVISNPSSVPLARLAELGVSRVSFGPTTMGLTLSHLRDAATTLTARGDYPGITLDLATPDEYYARITTLRTAFTVRHQNGR